MAVTRARLRGEKWPLMDEWATRVLMAASQGSERLGRGGAGATKGAPGAVAVSGGRCGKKEAGRSEGGGRSGGHAAGRCVIFEGGAAWRPHLRRKEMASLCRLPERPSSARSMTVLETSTGGR